VTSTNTITNTTDDPFLKPWALPPRSLSVYYGTPQTPRLSHYFLPRLLTSGQRIMYLDGANQIDPLLIARFARERGVEPSEFNSLIRIARAFTCFQLTELIHRVPFFLEKFPANVLIVTALPDIYFDEDIRDREARATFEHALESLRLLAQQPVSVVLFSDATSFPTQRRDFFTRLVAQADHVTRIKTASDNQIIFTREKARPLLPI
jgi:hypothetical protein